MSLICASWVVCWLPALLYVNDELIDLFINQYSGSKIALWLQYPNLSYLKAWSIFSLIANSYDGLLQPLISIILGVTCVESVRVPAEVQLAFGNTLRKWTVFRFKAFILWRWILNMWILPLIVMHFLSASDWWKPNTIIDIPPWMFIFSAFSTFGVILVIYIFCDLTSFGIQKIILIAYSYTIISSLIFAKIDSFFHGEFLAHFFTGGKYAIVIILHWLVLWGCNSLILESGISKVENTQI